MSDLHDLIMALPEGATLEITRGVIDGSVVIDLDISYRNKGIALGTALVLEGTMVAHRVLPGILLDERARAILHDPRFAGVPA